MSRRPVLMIALIIMIIIAIITVAVFVFIRNQVESQIMDGPDMIDGNPLGQPITTTDPDPNPATDPGAPTDPATDPGTPVAAAPVPLPEGVTLTGLKFNQSGSWMGPWFTLRKTEDGFEARIGYSQLFWEEMDGADYETEAYWVNGSTVREEEQRAAEGDYSDRVSRVHCSEVEVAELLDSLLAYNVLSWDGFDESESAPPGVLDMDDRFDFRLLFSDGSTVSAEGYNCVPPGFNEVSRLLYDFFTAREDYSAYYPAEFPEAGEVRRLYIACPAYSVPGMPYFKVELTRGRKQWIFVLEDPHGDFITKGFSVSDYAFVDDEDTLPFADFLDLLREYGFAERNGQSSSGGDSRQYLEIRLYYENGQEYEYITNEYPANYETFQKACVNLMYEKYRRLSGN